MYICTYSLLQIHRKGIALAITTTIHENTCIYVLTQKTNIQESNFTDITSSDICIGVYAMRKTMNGTECINIMHPLGAKNGVDVE